jgi:hypothetical protein
MRARGENKPRRREGRWEGGEKTLKPSYAEHAEVVEEEDVEGSVKAATSLDLTRNARSEACLKATKPQQAKAGLLGGVSRHCASASGGE